MVNFRHYLPRNPGWCAHAARDGRSGPVLSGYGAIPPNEYIARRAYYLMKTFARSHGLHTLDALIAATAMEEGLTLVSKNRKHFRMISDLSLEVPDY